MSIFQIDSIVGRLYINSTERNESFEEKQKRNDELLISALSETAGTPLDYSECKSMINRLRLLLSHRNNIVRTLAAKKIIELVPQLLTLAYLFFGFSKSALKDVAKEMLELMGIIGGMQEKGQISLSCQDMSDFNNVINQLVQIIAEGDEEEKEKLLSKFQLKNKSKSDEFVTNKTPDSENNIARTDSKIKTASINK